MSILHIWVNAFYGRQHVSNSELSSIRLTSQYLRKSPYHYCVTRVLYVLHLPILEVQDLIKTASRVVRTQQLHDRQYLHLLEHIFPYLTYLHLSISSFELSTIPFLANWELVCGLVVIHVLTFTHLVNSTTAIFIIEMRNEK